MKKILAAMPFTEEDQVKLQSIAPDCAFVFKSLSEVTEEDVQDVDVILGNVEPKIVAKASKLQWMQTNSVGAAQYCADGVLPESTVLTCAKGAYDTSVSEWLVTVSFMLSRKMDLYMHNQMEHTWRMEGGVSSLEDSTTLILGLGSIGHSYAKKMKALGSYVIGVTRHAHTEKAAYVDEMYTIDQLDELLPRADFVVMILPGTKENTNLIDARRLGLMKPSAYLLNAGRGNSVNSLDLNEALHAGTIAGAALDVTEPEPLPADHPLWDAPRCIICPHVAGKFFLAKTFRNIVKLTEENLTHFLAGDLTGIQNKVKRDLGY